MTNGGPSLEPITIIGVLWLAVCGVQDFRTGMVSNWLTLPGLAAGAVVAIAEGGGRLAIFGALFTAFVIVHSLGGIGGADAKVLAGLSGLDPGLLTASLAGLALWGIGRWMAARRGSFKALPVAAISCILPITMHIVILSIGKFI